jgi:hypothetical protein
MNAFMISKALSGPPNPASASATIVDALGKLGRGIGRVERLVRIHGGSRVGIGGNLPAGEVDCLQAGADHLHGLVAGKCAERVDEVLLMDELPEAIGTHFGERMTDLNRAAQALDVLCRVRTLDAVVTALRRGRNKVVKISHYHLP